MQPLSYTSWNTNANIDNSGDSPKKRVPSMRKTIKMKPFGGEGSILGVGGGIGLNENGTADLDEIPDGIAKLRNENIARDQTINQLLETMTSVDADNEGGYLANFQPPPKPEMTAKPELPAFRASDEPIPLPENEYRPTQAPQFGGGSKSGSYTSVDFERQSAEYSNYNRIYDPNRMVHKPYYMKGGMSQGGYQGSSVMNDKLMEKINYMIHMLEQQDVEKTANITEEFILYTFLGVFIIYIVDSFSRSGRYIR